MADRTPLTGEEVATIWNAMIRKDPNELAALVVRYPEDLVVNVKRSAIQLRSCSGDIILGSVPVPSDLIADIRAAQAERATDS